MLERRVEAFLRAHCEPGQRLLVAVSGGRDSSVLLEVLAALGPDLGLAIAAGHVAHGLRGAEAERDAAFVCDRAHALELPHFERSIAPRALRSVASHRERPTLQEAARALRYEALESMASEWRADWTATAHHADDQAETVLMALLRGCGPDGLAGIPPVCRERRLLRPLLSSPGSEVASFAAAAGLPWREDESNQSPAYTRNRVRSWLPRLAEEFNPRLLRALAQLAEVQRGELEWTEPLVRRELERRVRWEEGRIDIQTEGFGDLPAALARRLVRRLLVDEGHGRSLSRQHLDRMVAFLGRGPEARGRVLELPAGIRIRHAGSRASLVVSPPSPRPEGPDGRSRREVLASERKSVTQRAFPSGKGAL